MNQPDEKRVQTLEEARDRRWDANVPSATV